MYTVNKPNNLTSDEEWLFYEGLKEGIKAACVIGDMDYKHMMTQIHVTRSQKIKSQ